MPGWFDLKPSRFALKAAVAYAIFAGLWIVASDTLVKLVAEEIAVYLELYKGLLFVAVTAILLYLLLRQERTEYAEAFPAVTPQRFTPLAPLLLFVVLAVAIGSTGYYIYSHQRAEFREHKEAELTAVADLRAKAVMAWFAERRGDAEAVQDGAFLSEAVRAWIRAGKPQGAQRQRLMGWLDSYWRSYKYRSVGLLDTTGASLLGVGESGVNLSAHEIPQARKAMARKEVQISDFHFFDGKRDQVVMDVMVPLLTVDGEVVGAVNLQIDPWVQLYPLLLDWPGQSETGESLLVRQEGSEVVFLSPLKKVPNAVLRLRFPLSQQTLPAALAAQGKKGVVEGMDYRGDAVLAVVRRVADSPWFMVTKVDRKEVFADFNRFAGVVVALTAVFVAVAALIVFLWWRRQRDSFLLREYLLEAESRQLASRLEMLSRYANDGIFLMDDRHRILDVNQRVGELHGYSRAELLSMEAADLRAPESRAALGDDWRRAEEGVGGGIFETLHQAKDGRVFPVEISLRRIESDGQWLHLGIVREITERRAAEAKILRLKGLYAALSQSNEAIIHQPDEASLFNTICRIGAEQSHFLLAWVGMVEDGEVKVKAAAGPAVGYLSGLKISVVGGVPESRGPTGTAIREARTFLCNDFMGEPATLPWREAASRFGIAASAAFPLLRGGKPMGALTLYSDQAGYFDQEVTALLEEMAADLSFAMDHFDQEAARRRAEAQLAESVGVQRAILDNIPDIAWLKDRESRFIAVNQPFAAACGKSNEELAGGTDWDIWPRELAEAYRADDMEVMRSRRRKQVEEYLVTADGRRLWIDAVRTPVFNPQGEVIGTAGIARDITERKEAEESIIRLSNFYATLSQTNEAIVRSKGRQELFEEVCRVAVAYGKLQAAFIRIRESADHQAVAVAHYGAAQSEVTGMRISLEDSSPEHLGPTGTALLQGVPAISNDFLNDPAGLPWHEFAQRQGIRAVAAFPLHCEGRVEGALTLYAGEKNFFNQQMVRLLQEMAVDLSFAMDNFAREEKRRAAEAALREQEEMLRSINTAAQDAVLMIDDEGTLMYCNPAAERILGYRAEEMLGQNLHMLLAPERYHEAFREGFAVFKETGTGAAIGKVLELVARRKDGTEFPVELSVSSFKLHERWHAVGIIRDITDRMEALEKMRLDAIVFEDSAEGIMITDGDLHIITVNPMFTAITGYQEQEVVGTRPSVLRSERHDEGFFQNMWAAINEAGHWVGEIWNRRKDGEVFPAWLSITAVKDDGGQVSHYIGVFTDVSVRKEAEERIRHLTHYDALTDLPNQFLLADHIALALAHAKRLKCFVAVMAVNLDRFRSVNDRYGHGTGDEVLQKVGRRIEGVLREGDTVARIGADNFAIVMPDLQDKHQAMGVAAKVLEAVAEPITFDGYELNMTARVGIALYPDDGDRPEELLKNADIALANAKAAGAHNYVFFTPEQSRELEETLAMESALRHAIERGELLLHYQPRLDLVSGGIVAVEALLRWQHPEQGLMLPGKFIPLAEQSGLILPIGEWVLREACRQGQEWHRAGFTSLRVSVNVSVLQLRQRGLVEVVRTVVKETGFNPTFLELEFTESFLMEKADETIGILHALRELGLRFSIDDFGTGYSSLSYLKLFPIDMLKIDQSFVRDITFDPAGAAIVQGMIALGHSLKLKMVAEGVETEAQMGYMRSIHCDEMQGFFFSRPLPNTDMYALLQSNKRLQDIAHTPGAVRKLLIVDDEPNITTALNRLLRREGYQILIAHSAREALEILAVNADVGVVLSDQRMPETSGIELLSKVKVLYPGIVRLILSGYTEVSTMTDAINKGEIYKFLTKPWEDDQLREVVREAFLRFELSRAEQRSSEP